MAKTIYEIIDEAIEKAEQDRDFIVGENIKNLKDRVENIEKDPFGFTALNRQILVQYKIDIFTCVIEVLEGIKEEDEKENG